VRRLLCSLPLNREPISYEGFGFTLLKQTQTQTQSQHKHEDKDKQHEDKQHDAKQEGQDKQHDAKDKREEVREEVRECRARRGRIDTPHGCVHTPAFVFCATKAAIKGGITPDMVRE
jgi:hypothetical protein